jgi:hypothetical protein
MNATTAAGALLIALPLLFNGAFAALSVTFDYPDILRRPTPEILERFRAGGSRLVLLWWVFAMTAVLLAPLAVLLSGSSSARLSPCAHSSSSDPSSATAGVSRPL